jgi:SAM-dependent methyltransferase
MGSLDLVTAVASLHHMDGEAALRRMSGLLRPGGVLAVVGLARGVTPADLYLQLPAIMGHRAHLTVTAWSHRHSRGQPADRYVSSCPAPGTATASTGATPWCGPSPPDRRPAISGPTAWRGAGGAMMIE